jgi:hypothetical protein
MVHQMEETYHDNVIIFEAHKGSDPMNNSIVDAWKANWNHSSTPSFVANDELLSGYPINPGKKVIDAMNAKDATVGLAATFTDDGTSITGTAFLKTFEEISGDYHLAIYAVGDGFKYKQIADDGSAHPDWEFDPVTKTYPNYIHTNTLRGEANDKAFGKSVSTGTVSADQVIKLDYSITKGSNWTETFKVVVIAWKKNPDNSYTFVNAASGTQM